MEGWLSTDNYNCSNELTTAVSNTRSTMRLQRASIKTTISIRDIETAFSWTHLTGVFKDLLNNMNKRLRYATESVHMSDETPIIDAALSRIDYGTQFVQGYDSRVSVTVIKVPKSADAAKDMLIHTLTATRNYEEMQIRPMLTTSTFHKIYAFKHTETPNAFVFISNIGTVEVLYKISTAVLLQETELDEDYKIKLATAWITGNPRIIENIRDPYITKVREAQKEVYFKNALTNMLDALKNNEINELNKLINNHKRDIDDYEDTLRALYIKLTTAQKQLATAKLTAQSTSYDSFLDMIKANKDKISYISFNDEGLTLVYKTTLMFFDEQTASVYYNSNGYNYVNHPKIDGTKELFKAAFIDKTHEILIESGVRLNLSMTSPRVEYFAEDYQITDKSRVGIPNPHHRYYDCWGNNKVPITTAITRRDYEVMLAQVFAALSSINMSDSIVLEKFLVNEVSSYKDVRYIREKATGVVYTLEEFKEVIRNVSDKTD